MKREVALRFRKTSWCLFILAAFVLWGPRVVQAQQKPLTVGYAALAAEMSPLWNAYEAKLFPRYGVSVEMVYLQSGSLAAQALVSGNVPIVSITGIPIVQAVLAGAPLVMVAGTVNAFPMSIVSIPSIRQLQDLKGKRMAVARFGSASDLSARIALEHFGLKPDRDVTMIQVGSAPNTLAAVKAGSAEAGCFTETYVYTAEKAGLQQLLRLGSLGLEIQWTGVAVNRQALAEHQNDLERFLKAYIQGIALFYKDPAFSKKVLGKYLRASDPELVEQNYKTYAQYFQKKPYPTQKGIQTILDILKARNPKAATAKTEDFIDSQIVAKLDREGFIDGLYKP
ncbi:MAG: ABC transporter substrate-binding protein [Candidatus Tectomicrobia bacterium]|uniref:ABC transporter substrate-binding protein n=1 Tax=Tectimicrobiota bacterium TaxID=2528274 RepID=A0A932GNG8_UNCTE|nr:ABC transporter substrate-binding protein [Candidatus Tectomicrobia bacterium]